MDINLTTPSDRIGWKQDRCPWNWTENTNHHKCAEKDGSICKFFRGVEYLDKVISKYPENSIVAKRASYFAISGFFQGKAEL